MFRNKTGLLRVLERPEIPLPTNACENDIRAFVTKRKISGGTVSENGRDSRDIMLGLAKTCRKLKLSEAFAKPPGRPEFSNFLMIFEWPRPAGGRFLVC